MATRNKRRKVHHARKANARGGGHHHHPRRRTTHRRTNPMPTTVLLANPAAAHVSRRRKPSGTVKRRAAAKPHKAHRRKRVAVRTIRETRVIRRRTNPMGGGLKLGNIGHIAGLCLFGGGGIILARVVGNQYSQHVSATILGDETDVKGWRHIANEALRLAAMAVATIVVERVLSKVHLLKPEYRHAFLAGGLAETGRQAIGVAVKMTSPTTDRAPYGLDGPQQWVLGEDGRYHPLGELEDAEAFAGGGDYRQLGELEDAEAFAGN